MVDLTDNHEFQLWGDSEEQWEHRSDFETLEQKIWVRDEDAALNDYEPHDGALFLATDTADVYLGDGDSWTLKWHLGDIGSGDGDFTSTEGIDNTTNHVGPMRAGEVHDTRGFGIHFWAEEGLTLESAVVHTDLSSVTSSDFVVRLMEYDSSVPEYTELGSTTIPVSGGPERIDLSDLPAIPADGEYGLIRDENSSGEQIPAWRIPSSEWGPAAYAEHTYDRIDIQKGIDYRSAGYTAPNDLYYYFFDIAIGPPTAKVTSPWSSDVDEIYMRPHDPLEEFDDVSPRALWIDTS